MQPIPLLKTRFGVVTRSLSTTSPGWPGVDATRPRLSRQVANVFGTLSTLSRSNTLA